MEYGQAELLQNFSSESPNRSMKTIRTRFGEVEYHPESVLKFPQGLIGFNHLHDFIVMPNEKQGPLFWIQSVDDPDVAFVLTDPTNFFPGYRVVPDKGERETLDLGQKDEVHVLSVVTVHQDGNITFNLQAPVLFAAHSNRATQVILAKTTYSTRESLPNTEK